MVRLSGRQDTEVLVDSLALLMWLELTWRLAAEHGCCGLKRALARDALETGQAKQQQPAVSSPL
jgi:hypothetical protein